MISTDQDFELQLDERPDDWTLRLVYSDWLEEHGNLKLAKAQRWMAENRSHSLKIKMAGDYPPEFQWIWGTLANKSSPQSAWSRQYNICLISQTIFEAIFEPKQDSPWARSWRYFDTRQEAELALADVLCSKD